MLGCVYDIADYMTDDVLAAPAGGFYSSEDADSFYRSNESEKREGAFYVWTRKEFDSILGEREAEVCAKFWNVKRHGNVALENDVLDEFTNQNVLAVVSTPTRLAKEFGLSEAEVVDMIKEGRRKLWKHRQKERPRPSLDHKIVTCWNGLAVGSLARASSVLHQIDPDRAAHYLKQATRAVALVRAKLIDESNARLQRIYSDDIADVPGFADDYSFFIWGLIHLYEATFDEAYLELADRLQRRSFPPPSPLLSRPTDVGGIETQISLFWDEQSSGFFSTDAAAPDLILRFKVGMDNAEPSPNGISVQNLYRLSSILNDESYAEYARKTCQAFGPELMQHPFLFSSMMPAVIAGALVGGVQSVVIAGQGKEVEEAVNEIRGRVRGLETLVRLIPPGDDDTTTTAEGSTWLRARNKLLREMRADKPSVMVCEGGVCREELDVGNMDMETMGRAMGNIT